MRSGCLFAAAEAAGTGVAVAFAATRGIFQAGLALGTAVKVRRCGRVEEGRAKSARMDLSSGAEKSEPQVQMLQPPARSTRGGAESATLQSTAQIDRPICVAVALHDPSTQRGNDHELGQR